MGDHDTGGFEPRRDRRRIASREPGRDDGRAFFRSAWRRHLRAKRFETVDQRVGKTPVVGENPINARFDEVFDRSGKTDATAVGQGAEFKSARGIGENEMLRADGPHIGVAAEAYQTWVETLVQMRGEIQDRRAKRSAQPFVPAGDNRVDAFGRRVERDGPFGLCGVYDKQRAVRMGLLRKPGKVVPLSAPKLDMRQTDYGGPVVDKGSQFIRIDIAAMRLCQPDLATGMTGYARPRVYGGGKDDVRADDVGLRTRHERPGERTHKLRST